MAYIKNPFGRIVEVSEERPVVSYNLKTGEPEKFGISDFDGWRVTPGFTIPTPEEVVEYEKERKMKIEKIKADEENIKRAYGKPGAYFITVSQGGKDGYGVASKNIYKELLALGTNISFNNEGQKIALLLHAPYSITRLESPIRILYTMFESTKLPDDWGDYLEQADRILVPSKWCQEVFKKAGFPSEVVPLGYDDNSYQYIPRKPKDLTKENFTFLHYNAFNIRKGFTEVFKAFVKEFRPDEPVRMIFKTTLPRMPIPLNPDNYPNIEVITGEVSDEEMQGILKRSDCFVFPSRGEGFGMTPLEAMATGLPTIIPNSTGMSEYFNPDFMYEVKIKEECPAIYSRYKNQDVGKMFISDVDDLAKQMRYVYEHQTEAIAKGQAASFYVKNWTFKKTAEKLKTIIDDMSKKPEVDRPLKNVLPLHTIRG